MEIINVEIHHKEFGNGVIFKVEGRHVIVRFYNLSDTKRFLQPDCFGKFLFFVDDENKKLFHNEVIKVFEQERLENQRESVRQAFAIEHEEARKAIVRRKIELSYQHLQKRKVSSKRNVVTMSEQEIAKQKVLERRFLLEREKIEAENRRRKEEEERKLLNEFLKIEEERERLERVRFEEELKHYENNLKFQAKFLKILKEYDFDGFHHYTDFSNLKSIFECKFLYCRTKAKSLGFIDGSEHSIIEHTPISVKDCVRFYFKECTPTLFINEGIRNTRFYDDYQAHMPIPVLLLFDENILNNRNIRVSNGGCGNKETIVTNDLETALRFDWESIFKRGQFLVPTDGADGINYRRYISNTRNAEFHIPNEISIENLKAIIFRSQADKKHAEFEFGTNRLFSVNHNKFNVKNGYPNDRNYLHDYEIIRTPTGFKGKLYFDSSPIGYTHKIRVHELFGSRDIPLDLMINGKYGEFEINVNCIYDKIEYLLNNFASAAWR